MIDEVLLAARAATRRYGSRVALGPVDLELRAGESLALLGPNGAGKTTLLSLLAGIGEPADGAIWQAEGIGVGFVPQRSALYRRLSARENLRLFAQLAGIAELERELDGLLAAIALGDRVDAPLEQLSGGQQQRVNVAIGLIGSPRVLLLDEPTAALDPPQRLALWPLLEAVTERRGAVCFATQNIEEARLAADRVCVLVDGAIRYVGDQDEFWRLAGFDERGAELAFVRFLEDTR